MDAAQVAEAATVAMEMEAPTATLAEALTAAVDPTVEAGLTVVETVIGN